MKIEQMAKNTWKFYKKHVITGKKTPKKMFQLGYIANVDETQKVKDLKNYQKSTCGLYATAEDPINLLEKFYESRNKPIPTEIMSDWQDFVCSRYNPFFKLTKNLIVDKTDENLKLNEATESFRETDKIKKLEVLADLLSRIFYYGNFKFETVNERTIAGILNDLGLFPTTEDDIIQRPEYKEYHQLYKEFNIEKNTNI